MNARNYPERLAELEGLRERATALAAALRDIRVPDDSDELAGLPMCADCLEQAASNLEDALEYV